MAIAPWMLFLASTACKLVASLVFALFRVYDSFHVFQILCLFGPLIHAASSCMYQGVKEESQHQAMMTAGCVLQQLEDVAGARLGVIGWRLIVYFACIFSQHSHHFLLLCDAVCVVLHKRHFLA